MALGIAGCVIASRTDPDDLMVSVIVKNGNNNTFPCDRNAVSNVGLVRWTWIQSGTSFINFFYFLSVFLTVTVLHDSVTLMALVILPLTVLALANLCFQFAWWIIGIVNIVNSKACAGLAVYTVDICFLAAPALGIFLQCLQCCCSAASPKNYETFE